MKTIPLSSIEKNATRILIHPKDTNGSFMAIFSVHVLLIKPLFLTDNFIILLDMPKVNSIKAPWFHHWFLKNTHIKHIFKITLKNQQCSMAVVLKNGKTLAIHQPRSNQLIDFSDTHHQKSSSYIIAIIADALRRIFKL